MGLLRQKVTVTPRTEGPVGAYNSPGMIEGVPYVLKGCGIAPGESVELQDSTRDGVSSDGTLYMPASATITRFDLVEVDGERWEAVGDRRRWTRPWGGTAGCTIGLNRVEG